VFIGGNHDFPLEKYPLMLKNTVMPEGTYYLNDSGVEIEGLKIWGSPIQPWFYNWAFNRDRGADIKKHWDLIPSDINILITHGPPYKILDETLRWNPVNPSKNVGCEDLTNKIKELNDLKVHIFGHIHEGYGEENIDGIKYLNASVLNTYYEMVNRPHLFEI
jgi:Icc-related predicted phosphoesterase